MKRSAYYYRFCSLIVALGLTFAMNVSALTLGHLKVLSFLGQPLVAEIDVPDISVDESTSLRVAIASPDAFKSAGLDYSPAIAQITIAGKRRADGRAILELRSTQAIEAPFLDLVLEITWNTGRMLRDYTVLLDPPATATQTPNIPAPTLPIQTSPAPIKMLPPPVNDTTLTTSAASDRSISDAMNGFSVKTQTMPKHATAMPKQRQSEPSKNGIKTRRGDTAAALASANKSDNVSLDQMLVAMLHSNPQAFVDGNVNRLKAGVVLDMPSEADARAVSSPDARQSIQVQAHDFDEYRRNLSANVTNNVDANPQRQAAGKVTARVEDHRPTIASDDRLTLAKPTVTNKEVPATEEKIAKERAASDAVTRSAELKKNISELNSIATASTPPRAVSDPAPPAVVVSAPVATPIAVRPPVRPAIVESPSLMDQMIANPFALLAAGGTAAVALLIGALFYLRRRRAKSFGNTQNTSIDFPPTRQPTDTVFGPIGASHIDTQEAPASLTMVYSPSQLATVTGDVDPIAEADVYLAYNRDVQAEEILKEAKRNQPNRSDIQVKLLEIYAKRHDVEAFDMGAQELHQMTDGEGEDWAKVRQLARDIGSNHSLFNVAASAFAVSDFTTSQSAYTNNSLSFVPTSPLVTSATTTSTPAPSSSELIDFDLSALTLDLPTQSGVSSERPSESVEDPKLALAEEYLSIGDKAGARGLIEEVIRQHPNPQIITQAQQMLARLG